MTDLIDRARAGDTDAFADIYREHHDPVLRYITRRTGNPHLAEDLTADVFVRALRKIDQFGTDDRGVKVGNWLMTIARNAVYDHFKSSRYRTEWLSPIGWDGTATETDTTWQRADPSPDADPEALALAGITGDALRAALARLEPDQRRVLELRFIHGLPITDVAAIMGRADTTVKALQYRATKRLAQHFTALWGER